VFVAAVAALIGVGGAIATVRGQRSADVLAIVASDPTAKAAHDLEVTLGEGPAATVIAARGPVRAGGRGLTERWPLFGPAVAELGIRSVVAVPLYLPAAGYLGVLCGYDRAPDLADDVIVSAGRMADSLTASVLLAPEVAGMLGADQLQAVVHQATGMVSVHCGCGTDDAEAMLRARAFADGRPIDEVARAVLRGEIRFC
jgi:hypothetical protein